MLISICLYYSLSMNTQRIQRLFAGSQQPPQKSGGLTFHGL